jgi:hypothetical protein
LRGARRAGERAAVPGGIDVGTKLLGVEERDVSEEPLCGRDTIDLESDIASGSRVPSDRCGISHPRAPFPGVGNMRARQLLRSRDRHKMTPLNPPDTK